MDSNDGASSVPEQLRDEFDPLPASEVDRLLQAGPAVVYTISLHPRPVLAYVSSNAEQLLGVQVGTESDDLLSRVHPDDRGTVLRGMRHARRRGSWVSEYRVLDIDKAWMRVRDHLRLVRDEHGRAIEIVGVVVDTGRSAALERAARFERQQLETVIDLLPVGVVVMAISGRVLLGGSLIPRLFGEEKSITSAAELMSYVGYWSDTGKQLGPWDWPLARTIQTGVAVIDEEVNIVRTDGTRRSVTMSTAPIRDADGALEAAALTFQDITDRSRSTRHTEALLDAERLANLRLERARGVADRLQRVTAALSRAGTQHELSTALISTFVPAVEAKYLWLGVRNQNGDLQTIVSNTPGLTSSQALQQGTPLPSLDVLRTGTAIWMSEAEQVRSKWPAIKAYAMVEDVALVSLPIRHGDSVIGVVTLRYADGTLFDEELRSMLGTLVEMLSSVIRRVRLLERERTVARTLQHSMLLSSLPVLPGVDIAAQYVAASMDLEVGGDWYDVLPLSDQRIGVVVGDVMGRGVRSAASMGQLRSALAALAGTLADPGTVLAELDAFSRRVEGAWLASVFYGVLDLESGKLHHSSAGHLPPIVQLPDGSSHLLMDGRAGLLGSDVEPGNPRPTAVSDFPPGACLVMYTDGLVERRDSDILSDCKRLLASIAAEPHHDATELCDELIGDLEDRENEAVSGDSSNDSSADGEHAAGARTDDVAVLVLRRTPDGEPVRSPFLGSASSAADLKDLRARTRQWLADLQLDEDIRYDLLLAVGEAAANAVEHAYPQGQGPVDVTARLDGETVTITVSDAGHWRGDADEGMRGKGFSLMRALTDSVSVSTTAVGTTVTLVRKVTFA